MHREDKLKVFETILAVPSLTVEERFWIETLKEFLEQGHFHDTWARLRAQSPLLETIVWSAIEKARAQQTLV